jgi:DNA-binding ferritin-like protein
MNKLAQKSSGSEALAALISYLRYLGLMYQNHHWQAKGNDFYGNHLFFERVYKQVLEDVDSLAEKTIGLYDVNVLRFHKQLSFIKTIGEKFADHDSTQDHLQHSIIAENKLVKMLYATQQKLKGTNELSLGLDNLLAELSDNSENRLYLLKQGRTL